jgi:hypothetical protein
VEIVCWIGDRNLIPGMLHGLKANSTLFKVTQCKTCPTLYVLATQDKYCVIPLNECTWLGFSLKFILGLLTYKVAYVYFDDLMNIHVL